MNITYFFFTVNKNYLKLSKFKFFFLRTIVLAFDSCYNFYIKFITNVQQSANKKRLIVIQCCMYLNKIQ